GRVATLVHADSRHYFSSRLGRAAPRRVGGGGRCPPRRAQTGADRRSRSWPSGHPRPRRLSSLFFKSAGACCTATCRWRRPMPSSTRSNRCRPTIAILAEWPPSSTQTLVTIFQVGWGVLHRDVSVAAADALLDALKQVQTDDRDLGRVATLVHADSRHYFSSRLGRAAPRRVGGGGRCPPRRAQTGADRRSRS